MKNLSEKHLVFSLLFVLFTIFVIVVFNTPNSFGGGDHFTHFGLARWGWNHPELLLDHWGKPIVTILMSPFAQFGINGARLYNVVTGFLTAILIWQIGKQFRFSNSWMAIILVVFTPLYFILMFTALTEVTFSFFLALAALLFFKEKYIWSAIALSFLPLIRTEGVVLLPLFVTGFILRRQFKSLIFISFGFLLFSFIGYFHFKDFWWLITQMPYSGDAKDIYGSGELLHFVNHNWMTLGLPITVLSVLGVVVVVINWIGKDKFRLTDNFYFLLLIPGSYLTFLAAHSYVWWQGMGNSLGLIRVMGSVTPFAALCALAGLSYLLDVVGKKYKAMGISLASILLVVIIYVGADTNKSGFYISPPQRLLVEAADYIKDNDLEKNKVYYFDPYLINQLDVDPYDQSLCQEGLPDKQKPSLYQPNGSIIVWDAHFGPNQGSVMLEVLKNDNDLTHLYTIQPEYPFEVLGGYNYEIHIFQITR